MTRRPEHDVVIVGGGPAGIASALFLVHARPELRGRMVVLEKERYPREKYCAGAIGGRAEMALARIGVSVACPGAPVSGISLSLPGGTEIARDAHIGRVVRRIEFDHALARIAAERGVTIREGVKVSGIDWGSDLALLDTTAGEIRARAVIGADGVGSVVRKALGLGAGTWRAQVLEVDTAPVPSDPARDLLHFDVGDPLFCGYAWDFPTIVGGEALACRGVYHLALPGQPAGGEDLTARLAERLDRIGLDLGKCKKKRYAERGFAPHEPCARPRCLLVGEAAGVDPITGEGIAQAILYGEALAHYLAPRLDRDELAFGDWPDALSRTMLGFDMRLRHSLCRLFFGPARPVYEGLFAAAPGGLGMGVRYFGGWPIERAKAARVALDLAGHFWKHRDANPFEALGV